MLSVRSTGGDKKRNVVRTYVSLQALVKPCNEKTTYQTSGKLAFVQSMMRIYADEEYLHLSVVRRYDNIFIRKCSCQYKIRKELDLFAHRRSRLSLVEVASILIPSDQVIDVCHANSRLRSNWSGQTHRSISRTSSDLTLKMQEIKQIEC